MKIKAEIGKTSINGYSIFRVITDETDLFPAVSVMMPTEIAKYLVSLVDADNIDKDEVKK